MQQMDYLRKVTGGEATGVYKFPPHLTLLYNFEPFSTDQPRSHAKELLKRSRDRFRSQLKLCNDKPSIRNIENTELVPEKWFSFDYPKSADSGNGFGAAISLLTFQNRQELSSLREEVQLTFPVDERQSKFHPHMSLVYAPQDSLDFLQKYTAQLQHEQFLLKSKLKRQRLWQSGVPVPRGRSRIGIGLPVFHYN